MPAITPGTIIMTSKPFVYVADLETEKRRHICDSCLEPADFHPGELRRCTGCHLVYYCDKSCQKDGWNFGNHKYECKGMKKLGEKGEAPMNLTRLLLRAIVKLQEDGKDYFDEIDTENGKVKRRFNDLVSKVAEINEGSWLNLGKVKAAIQQAKSLLKLKPDVKIPKDEEELLEIGCRVLVNSTDIVNKVHVGVGIYLGGSIFPHSCDPMAVRVFKGPTLIVRNIKEIPDGLPIKKVTVSVDILRFTAVASSDKRKKWLKKYHLIDCHCEMCETGRDDQEMRSILCRKKSCNAKIDTELLKDPCPSCGHQLSQFEILNIMGALSSVTGSGLGIFMPAEPNAFLEHTLRNIRLLEEHKFSKTHWAMISQYQVACVASENLGKLEEALRYGKKYVQGLRRYANQNNPELGEFLAKVAKMAMFADKMDEAEAFKDEAKGILKICYGEDSSMYQRNVLPLEIDIEQMKMLKRWSIKSKK